MFLNENVNTAVQENSEMGYDPIYAMQIMQEATDDWNDICMKMIKLEHTAIMKEDTNLLQEGAKEAITRFKQNIQVLARKVVEFLERVRVQWSKVQAAIATKFVNQAAVQSLLGQFKSEGTKRSYKVNLPKNWQEVLTTVDHFAAANKEVYDVLAAEINSKANVKALASGEDTTTNDKIDAILAKYKFKEVATEGTAVTLTAQMIQSALTFLKKRPVAIKNIETLKSMVTKIANANIKALDEKDAKIATKNEVVAFQRACNKTIITINKATTLAVKICNAVKGGSDKTGIADKDVNKAYKDAKQANKNGKKDMYSVKNESTSLLDQFA